VVAVCFIIRCRTRRRPYGAVREFGDGKIGGDAQAL
jgi:hypothetical protein